MGKAAYINMLLILRQERNIGERSTIAIRCGHNEDIFGKEQMELKVLVALPPLEIGPVRRYNCKAMFQFTPRQG